MTRSHRPLFALPATSIAMLLAAAGTASAQDYYPPSESQGGWRSLVTLGATPSPAAKQTIRDTVGLEWDTLNEAWSMLQPHGGNLLVIRYGWIAGEWGSTQPIHVASCTKSLTSIAVARMFDMSEDGLIATSIDIDDFAHPHLPAIWSSSEPAKLNIKFRHLLTMSSGLEPFDTPTNTLAYRGVIISLPTESPIDTSWAYSSAAVDLLSVVVQGVDGRKLSTFFNTEIGAQIGAAPFSWRSMGTHTLASSFAEMTARDLARVAYLMLRNGLWSGEGPSPKRVVRPWRVAEMTRHDASLDQTTFRVPNFFTNDPESQERYAQLFWTNANASSFLGPSVPTDCFYMAGFSTQICMVIPSLDLIIVRQGTAPRPFDDTLVANVSEKIVNASISPNPSAYVAIVGSGCQSMGTRPILTASRPVVGKPLSIVLLDVPPSSSSVLVFGDLATQPRTLANGCDVYIDLQSPTSLHPLLPGVTSVTAGIPNDVTLYGMEIAVQASIRRQGRKPANVSGFGWMTSTNALKLVLGE